jgi:hypothetical protein
MLDVRAADELRRCDNAVSRIRRTSLAISAALVGCKALPPSSQHARSVKAITERIGGRVSE